MLHTEARDTARDSALHIGTATFDNAKVDRAIRDSMNQFHREVHCSSASSNITVAADAATLNITSTVSTFEESKFITATINNRPVRLAPYESVIRRFDLRTPVGQPEWISFLRDDLAQLDKQADVAYTMVLTYWQTETFTVGATTAAADATTLLVPDPWAGDVVRWGTRAYMIHGAPGHPDSDDSMRRFELLIARAKKHFAHNKPELFDRIPVPDVTPPSQNGRRTSRRRR